MKKILISLSIIIGVASIVIGATEARFFRRWSQPTWGTSYCSRLDLEIDIDGVIYDPFDRRIFLECDMKPGDSGEETLSLHVNQDACGFVKFDLRRDLENGCTEPESLVDDTCGCCGGELNDQTNWIIWKDEGSVFGWQCGNTPECEADSKEGDNILNAQEEILLHGALDTDKYYAFGEMKASEVSYYGFMWCFGEWEPGWTCSGVNLGNETQTDSFWANVVFTAQPKRYSCRNGCPVGEVNPRCMCCL